jgi:adenylate cyclase
VLGHAVGLLTRRIAGKIIFPYVLVICLLFILITYIVIHLVTSSLEEKFREELAGAGRSANEAMVLLEDHQLTVLRQMVFTEGVDLALANRDSTALQSLLAPIAANSRVHFTDAFASDGTQLVGLRFAERNPEAAAVFDSGAPGWEPVRKVLARQQDSQGDKFAGFVASRWGQLFVLAGPVYRDGRPVGLISLGMPMEEVVRRLSQEAGGKGITLYDGAGAPMASTIRASASALSASLALPSEQIAAARDGSQVVIRRVSIGDILYLEALNVLAIRREPVLLMGTGNLFSIVEERGAQARNLIIGLFVVVLVVVLLIGIFLARRLTRPVYTMVAATERVRRNELGEDVPVQTDDEHGILAMAMNDMQVGLRERNRAQIAIERYMSPKVYKLIQSGELRMGGVSREITVFKTDIRDFTELSERMDPHALVEFLNRYFEAMVAAIAKYDGEVDKYMGDAILAKFGATEPCPDHAERAVLAMIEMIEACERFGIELRREGLEPVRMGIGANTGEAVVGNIGSSQRMEYTIISDAVNTAERIEGLCKEVGWDLLISEQTYAQAQNVIEVGRPWSMRLRGQTRDTLVYPVLGSRGAVSPRRRQAYESLASVQLAGEKTFT